MQAELKEIKRRLMAYAIMKNCIEQNELEIRRIEKALSKISSDKDYGIIEMEYFKKMKQTEIADTLFFDTSTIARRKRKLLMKLARLLNGE